MSQSINSTRSSCDKEYARLIAAVDLPSPGMDDVIVMTFRIESLSSRQIAVLAVLTDSANVRFLSGISSGLRRQILLGVEQAHP